MNQSKRTIFTLLTFGLLSLAGCGGSNNGTSSLNDPLANQGTPSTPVPSGSGAALSYTLTLTTTSTSGSAKIGPNSSVIATATLKDSNGNLVDGPILFDEVIPDSATAPSVSFPVNVLRTSSGVANLIFRTLNPENNQDVIIRASTTANNQEVSAVSIFKIVRNAGNYINFITTKNPTDPDGNINTLKVEIVAVNPTTTPFYNILQLATFEVLDRNGANRTGARVTLDIYSVLGNTQEVAQPDINGVPQPPLIIPKPVNGIPYVDNCYVFIDSPAPEPIGPRTVTTDNTGLGIFNSFVTIKTPEIGGETSCSVIYKATASGDPLGSEATLNSYGGYIVTLKNLRQ
jgi:hypothetical protein